MNNLRDVMQVGLHRGSTRKLLSASCAARVARLDASIQHIPYPLTQLHRPLTGSAEMAYRPCVRARGLCDAANVGIVVGALVVAVQRKPKLAV